jgi:baculoviral IAP repeat-containing protein 6
MSNYIQGKFWARGTGYGHGHTNKVDWDVQAYLAAQKQKDRETQSIIEGTIVNNYM